jgi:threonine aldolase
MRRDGVLIGAFGARRLRIVTHLDVDEAGGDALCASMRRQLTAKRMSAE